MQNDIEKNGPITKNSMLIFNSNWAQNFYSQEKYRNEMNFPYIHEDVIKKYLNEICGIGIDTFSPDCGTTTNFPNHKLLLQNEKIIIENIHENINKIPARGAFGIALPLKIEKSAESPIRFLGLF